MRNINNDNITFFLEEKEQENLINNEEEIEKMMAEFTDLQSENKHTEFDMYNVFSGLYNEDDYSNMEYYLQKLNYGNDESFYEQEYTVKDLLKICSYYEIDKDIRTSKCKKSDIIATIIYFESLPENSEIVKKRNRMWAYITELLHDPKMKKFIIF